MQHTTGYPMIDFIQELTHETTNGMAPGRRTTMLHTLDYGHTYPSYLELQTGHLDSGEHYAAIHFGNPIARAHAMWVPTTTTEP